MGGGPGGGPAAAHALHDLIGPVIVTEARRPDRKRQHLRGTFRVSTAAVLESTWGAPGDPAASAGPEVVLEFVDRPRWAAVADDVKALFDAGVAYRAMAERLGCPRSWPAKALGWWHRQRGLAAPDGRAMKSRLERPAAGQEADERVMALYREGVPLQEIARRRGCCRDTVTAVVRRWHEARGLPVPDGRHRRKALNAAARNNAAAGPNPPPQG